MATTTSVIRDIRNSVYRDPDTAHEGLWELTTNCYWHIPDKIFEGCHCADNSDGKACDRVQVLLPTKFPRLLARKFRSPSEPLPANGAVIFGNSWKFPLWWPSEPGSVPTEIEQQLLPDSRPHSSLGGSASSRVGRLLALPSDSGLGTSVASSSSIVELSSGHEPFSSQGSVTSDDVMGRSGRRDFFSRSLFKLKHRRVMKERKSRMSRN